MDIVIINVSPLVHNMYATSILRGLKKVYPESNITWVCPHEDVKQLVKRNKKINSYFFLEDFLLNGKSKKFDLLINLSPELKPKMFESITAEEYRGFNSGADDSYIEEVLYSGKKTSMNLFQVYYNLAGLKWAGEGFDLAYYPRNRCEKNRAGIAIANVNIKRYIEENLVLQSMKKSSVPLKKNVLKRMDEINSCSHIVTDDFLTMSLAVSLRKFVHFLHYKKSNVKIEFFGKGQEYIVPERILI